MSDQEFENYLVLLSRFLRLTPLQREAISGELRDHLEQRLAELLEQDVPREEAVRLALEEFGDATALAAEFTSIARDRKKRWMMRITMTSVFGLAASILMLIAFWPGASNSNSSPLGNANAQDKAQAETSRGVLLTKFQQRIHDSLNWTDSFDVKEVPLSEWAKQLEQKLGAPVRLDKRALEDIGLEFDTPVSLQVKGISNRSAMRLVLESMSLTYVIDGEYIRITSMDEAESRLGAPRAYPVWDLIVSDDAKAAPDYDTLIELVTSVCQPDSWDEVGGPGSISGYKGLLLVAQTDTVHESIELLIRSLRKVGKSDEQVIIADSPTVGRYMKAMNELIDLSIKDQPLAAVGESLSKKIGLPVTLDIGALEDAGIEISEPVSVEATRMSARSALELLLNDIDAVAIWRHETIRITSNEMAEGALSTRIYPVEDVITVPEGKGDRTYRIGAELNNLIELITTTIEPQTWDEVGGPSTVTFYVGRKAIICSTTENVHSDIEQFLQLLRSSRTAENAAPADALVDPPTMLVQVYPVPAGNEDGVVESIKKLVVPKSWLNEAEDYEGAEITTLPGRVLIRQSNRNHQKIRSFLQQAGIAGPFGGGIGGGGMGGMGGGGGGGGGMF